MQNKLSTENLIDQYQEIYTYQKIKNQMNTSRKIEKPIISSSRQTNHINSIVIPEKKLLRSKYHLQKTLQLQAQNQNVADSASKYRFQKNPYNQYDLRSSSVVDEIEQIFTKQTGKLNRAFKAISTKPIISNPNSSSSTLISNFQESDYPLQNDQRVQVCHNKVFQIKNYYNYLFDLALQGQNDQLMKQSQDIRKLMVKDVDKQFLHKNLQIEQKEKEYQRGLRQSIYKKRTVLKREEHVMDPKHIQYEQDRQRSSFNVKQIDRLKKSKLVQGSGIQNSKNYDSRFY